MEWFYADPCLQAAWSTLVLYPVCLKAACGGETPVPVYIGELGDGEQVLDGCVHGPVLDLVEREFIERFFERVDN